MDSSNLANLAKIGKLKAEPGNQKEFDGVVRSGSIRLEDARKVSRKWTSWAAQSRTRFKIV